MITEVTHKNFNSILESGKPILLDFQAVWCAPCRMMNPHIEALAKELDGNVTVAKIDVDKMPEVAQSYGVQGIPAFILLVDGSEVTRITGAVSPTKLHDIISEWM